MLAQAVGLEDCDLRDHEQLVVQLLHRPGLGRHGCQYERQRHACEPAGEIDQPAQGCEIRQVCVVHGQQHGSCVGQIHREPVEPMQRRKRRLGVAFGVGHKEDGPCKRRRAVEQGFTLICGRGHHYWLQELPDDPERQLALELAPPRRQNAQVPRRRSGGREQARLADPRRPFEDHGPARARSGAGEQALYRLELELALNERSQLHSHHTILERS